jgi:hypothetical protein
MKESAPAIVLINCPACNSEVSNQAVACPKCGQPINASSVKAAPPSATIPLKKGIGYSADNSTKMIILGVILIIAAVVSVIGAQYIYEHGPETIHVDLLPNNLKESTRAEQLSALRTKADVMKYGGIGAGAIGGILLIVGLLKKNE